MINAKPFIFELLNDDATLRGLLGGDTRIHYFFPRSFGVVPCMSYNISAQANEFFADNLSVMDSITVDVQAWVGEGDTERLSAIAARVDTLMRAALYCLTFSQGLFDASANLYSHILRYSRQVTAEDVA